MFNAITAFIPGDDRLVFIEDPAEIQSDKLNIIRFEARREQRGAGRAGSGSTDEE